MRFTQLKIRGFRGFNEEQPIDLSDPISVFEGPNGSGKTSIGEAVEWLLYGKTLKRAKGEELSKREYTGCYKNIHFIGPGLPFVEAMVEDLSGKDHTIRRELNDDEASALQVDGVRASNLRAFGIDTMYDRPLILQHTLQDFIFMKPKGRYEVLSAMLGLDPLIAFRNAIETAKAMKERAQLDWGRFSALVVSAPADTPAIRKLAALATRIAKLREHLAAAASPSTPDLPVVREQDPNRRQFY